MPPSVAVDQPGGSLLQAIGAAGTTTITALAPGAYAVTASNVTVNGYTYQPTVTTSPLGRTTLLAKARA